ncbi:MAG: helix-turn-helix domain-containing protein [Verrucomicrobiia bacterium]|jgi:AraC-like DNA-binding protein
MKDHAHLHDLCRLRSTLEAFAVQRWRASHERERVGGELRRQIGVLKRYALRGDYAAFHAADQQFHRAAVAAANLEPLLKSWEIVAAELDEWILRVKRSYWPNLMALYREHELLLDAWQSEDDWVAEQATHQHVEAGWYRLRMAKGQRAEDLDPVQRAVSFIATHFTSHLDVAWVAQHVSFVSASHMARLFRSRLGISPLRHLKQVRLERAAQLLRSSADAVATIARRVGYRNASHFVRDFRRMFKATPLNYRRRGKG